jgi:hypothetical protein
MDEVSPEFKKAWAADYTIPSDKLAYWTKGGWPFEGGAYWFDGLVRLGYALHDEGLIAQAKRRMGVVVDNMNDKGISFFWWLDRNNPADVAAMSLTKKSQSGEDFQWAMWANGIFGRPFAAYCAATKDPKAIRALEMAYCGNRQWTRLGFALVNPWPAYEAYTWSGNAEIKAALVDLFTKPGDPQLVDWERRYRNNPKGIGGGHAVERMESAGPWALGYLVTGDRSLYDAAAAPFKQAYTAPNGALAGETCTVCGCIWSELLLLMVGGEGGMADGVERAFFNAAAATVSRDFTKHVYHQEVNRIPPAGKGSASFQKTHGPLCCTASVNRFLGYFVTHQWYATYDNGLAAALYGPCRLSALAGDGVPVEIVCKTDYPFDDRIEMTVKPAKETAFPLLLRIPRWCDSATLALNGTAMPVAPDEKGFVRFDRTWKAGDTIHLRFPMTIRVASGTISYGPLLFALPIPDTTDENTPDPAARWNFALDMDPEKKGADMAVERGPMPAKWNWPLASPLKISVPAVAYDLKPDARSLPRSAVASGTAERITLIPYGCAKLRVSRFPITERALKLDAPKTK